MNDKSEGLTAQALKVPFGDLKPPAVSTVSSGLGRICSLQFTL